MSSLVGGGLPASCDVAVIGAGAAGLFAAITAAAHAPGLSVVCLDGARTIGAKILVSGGSRCNVTNARVTEADFRGGQARAVRSVLRAFPASRAVEWFAEAGVPLHEEDRGRLFPDTNRSRTVLDALLARAHAHQVRLVTGHRVTAIAREADGFRVSTAGGDLQARAVVLATGGQSLPKSGSDGFGYTLARACGHTLVPPVPALVPLAVASRLCAALSGVSHDAALTLTDGTTRLVVTGPLLWTHTGVSGPAALDLSRHWLRAQAEGRAPEVRLSVRPGLTFEALERQLVDAARVRPAATLRSEVAGVAPASVVEACLTHAGVDPVTPVPQLTREARRAAIRGLIELPLPITGSRGFQLAEVTAGGVALDEIDPATMASRRCDGLYLVGEILDVDGRLGGFNFQWAWSSGWVAGVALARRLGGGPAAR